MPFSDGQGKDVALSWYEQIQPATVVDVGAGCGTYAKLMRTKPWRDHWTAIEAWQPYLTEYELRSLYDQVILSDARHLNWPDYRADLVIAGDVLEHMTRDDANRLIRRLKQAAGNVIISIPVLHLAQGPVNGNPYERHIDHWSAGAMAAQLQDGLVQTWVGNVLGYFWWSREVAARD